MKIKKNNFYTLALAFFCQSKIHLLDIKNSENRLPLLYMYIYVGCIDMDIIFSCDNDIRFTVWVFSADVSIAMCKLINAELINCVCSVESPTLLEWFTIYEVIELEALQTSTEQFEYLNFQMRAQQNLVRPMRLRC
jgi:hypothetical protein